MIPHVLPCLSPLHVLESNVQHRVNGSTHRSLTGSLEGLQLSTKKEDFKNNVSLPVQQTITSQEHQAETVLFQHSARQTPSETITKNQHSKECNPSSQIPGPRLQSLLTCQENFLAQGNKKKGFSVGQMMVPGYGTISIRL